MAQTEIFGSGPRAVKINHFFEVPIHNYFKFTATWDSKTNVLINEFTARVLSKWLIQYRVMLIFFQLSLWKRSRLKIAYCTCSNLLHRLSAAPTECIHTWISGLDQITVPVRMGMVVRDFRSETKWPGPWSEILVRNSLVWFVFKLLVRHFRTNPRWSGSYCSIFSRPHLLRTDLFTYRTKKIWPNFVQRAGSNTRMFGPNFRTTDQ